ncbi:hypothetical protein J6590_038245 [Homalodisca vitripennis]|nr:hypothetical protein J6590_038245 [Homalodisca vitripennis]
MSYAIVHNKSNASSAVCAQFIIYIGSGIFKDNPLSCIAIPLNCRERFQEHLQATRNNGRLPCRHCTTMPGRWQLPHHVTGSRQSAGCDDVRSRPAPHSSPAFN